MLPHSSKLRAAHWLRWLISDASNEIIKRCLQTQTPLASSMALGEFRPVSHVPLMFYSHALLKNSANAAAVSAEAFRLERCVELRRRLVGTWLCERLGAWLCERVGMAHGGDVGYTTLHYTTLHYTTLLQARLCSHLFLEP